MFLIFRIIIFFAFMVERTAQWLFHNLSINQSVKEHKKFRNALAKIKRWREGKFE